jgi:hypothetical protein
MPYRIAGIDVQKKMLAVVVADVEADGDFHFQRPNGRHDAGRLAAQALVTPSRACAGVLTARQQFS